MTEVGPSVLRRAREREHREVYTKTEKSNDQLNDFSKHFKNPRAGITQRLPRTPVLLTKETRYKILLENQNFLFESCVM